MGYPDAGMRRFVGCSAKNMESYVTWARYLASAGLVAITYTNTDPVADADRVLRHVRDHAAALGVDPGRIAVWSCSGNVPTALRLLMNGADLACAVLLYGYTMDLDGSTAVAEARAQFHFADPMVGRSFDDLPRLPLCMVRAGQDAMPRLNESLDRFIAQVLKANRPFTLINADDQPHAFDSQSDTDAARAAIEQILAFLASHLGERLAATR
jgi:acetyl esterase/lipase